MIDLEKIIKERGYSEKTNLRIFYLEVGYNVVVNADNGQEIAIIREIDSSEDSVEYSVAPIGSEEHFQSSMQITGKEWKK